MPEVENDRPGIAGSEKVIKSDTNSEDLSPTLTPEDAIASDLKLDQRDKETEDKDDETDEKDESEFLKEETEDLTSGDSVFESIDSDNAEIDGEIEADSTDSFDDDDDDSYSNDY